MNIIFSLPRLTIFSILLFGSYKAYSWDEETELIDDSPPSISLDVVRSRSVVISWEKNGTWADVDNFTVDISTDNDTDTGCSRDVYCDDLVLCVFDSEGQCDNINPCSTFDISVEGNGTIFHLDNVTSAPPPPLNVTLEINGTNSICSWSTSSEGNYSCHETTDVVITTPRQPFSLNVTSTTDNCELMLSACDVGEVNCSVTLLGGTGGASEEVLDVTEFTDESAGSLISSLDILPYPDSLEISWSLEEECERIGGYLIQVSDEGSSWNVTRNTTSLNVTVGDLVPCSSYLVEVQPLKGSDIEALALPYEGNATTSSSAPGPTDEVICEEPSTGYEFNVSWTPPPRNNCVKSYSLNYTGFVLWSDERTQNNTTCSASPLQLQELIPWTFYNVCVAGVIEDGSEGAYNCCSTETPQEAPGPPENFNASVTGPYTIQLSWGEPLLKNGNLTGYRISWDNETKSFPPSENEFSPPDLSPRTFYNFTIQAKTDEDNFGEGSSLWRTTPPEDETNAITMVAIASVSVIALIMIVLAFVCRTRIHNFKTKMVARIRRRSNYTVSMSSHDGHMMPQLERQFQSRKIHKTEALKKDELRQYIADLEYDSQKGLEEEFALLKRMSSVHPARASRIEYNKEKNRYSNILPYDHARVILKEQDVATGSDYINASYIEDANGERTFVASQGPKESTTQDFWRMIWELECLNIVMLTNLMERGREKCFMYWPDVGEGPQETGNITVHNLSEEESELHVIRNFEITNSSDKTKRTVRQFHFTAWPDYGAPTHEEQLLDFISVIRRQKEGVGTPMVVHCSAGVGRTGTFIGAWNLIDLIRRDPSSPWIDIRGEVLAIRECRPSMVQSQDQFLYLCKCIAAYLENPVRWSMESDSAQDQSYDNDAYEDEPHIIYEKC
ncbi:receptor-type tyrosine-protein phosphatase eta-like [Palaemon carinicauda]|uniref:receptor-type tyrosine-protein phosphatase eta-like n=1 Tax=Palaemon carinicauda TaxID=392227 RepID=UPI0035B5C8C7